MTLEIQKKNDKMLIQEWIWILVKHSRKSVPLSRLPWEAAMNEWA